MTSSAVFLLLLFHGALASYTPQWKQPRLFVSFWYDPVVPQSNFPAAYAQIALANFTAVLGGFGAKTADAIEAQLSAADALDLGVVAATNYGGGDALPISDYGGNHPSLWGYQIKDEPAASEFADLAAYSDQVAAQVPGKLRFSNLLPHCPPKQLNATDYDDYVTRYARVIRARPTLQAHDHL